MTSTGLLASATTANNVCNGGNMNAKTRSYLFSCKMKNGRKETRTGIGENKRQAMEYIKAMFCDVIKVTPNYIILKGV